jgi:hypothetical protein
MNDIRDMFRAAPGLVISVGSMLAVAMVLGLTALIIS